MKKIIIFLKIVLIPITIIGQNLTTEMVSNSGWYKSEYLELNRNYQGGRDIKGTNSTLFHINPVDSIIETDIELDQLRYSKFYLDSIYYSNSIKDPHFLFDGRDYAGLDVDGGVFWITGKDGRDLVLIMINIGNETQEFETYATDERFDNWKNNPLTPTNLIAEQSKYIERDYTDEEIDSFFISMGINPKVGRQILLQSLEEESKIIPKPRLQEDNIRIKDLKEGDVLIIKEK